MSRDVQTDFAKLLEYLLQYNLEHVAKDPQFIANAKIIHRKLYSFLVFIGEAENNNPFSHSEILNYYGESGSDLILALFCWSNGAYKPAEFQLRSAIENFIKASLYDEWHDVLQCTSVFEIMNTAFSSNFFGSTICQTALAQIRNSYANLCAFVHSSPDKLTGQRSLIVLPQYDAGNSNEFTQNFQAVVNSMLTILYYSYFDFIFSIHVINRDLFLHGLTTTIKAKITKRKQKNPNFIIIKTAPGGNRERLSLLALTSS